MRAPCEAVAPTRSEGILRIARLTSMIALVFAATAVVLPYASAAPTQIAACGLTAVTDVKLVMDLVCPDAGIFVGKSGITVDLNGHTLTGSRTPAENGIDNEGGFDDVTVRDGAVEKFSRGVVGISADRMHVARVVSSGNLSNGILLSGTSVTVVSSDASSNSDADDGIRILGDFARVRSSQASGNGGNGITITGASASVVASHASGNETNGIHVDGAKARIRSSIASTNQDDGVDVSGGSARIGQMRGGSSSDRNRAHFNGFVDGVSDGFGQGYFVDTFTLATAPEGRNVARGNDDAAQCNPIHLC